MSIAKPSKNDIPVLLGQLCTRPDCPDWLKEGIWDAVNEAVNISGRKISFNEAHWQREFEILAEVKNG